MNGKYFFTIGSFEKDGYQSSHLDSAQYIGRVKTKNKYLCFLQLLGTTLVEKKTLNKKLDLEFFKKYSDYIIGDLYYIEDIENIKKLDELHSIEYNVSYKKNIKVVFQDIKLKKKNNKELESFTYFYNTNNLETELLNVSKDTINEYTEEMKISAKETLIMLDMHKGDDTKEEWFKKLEKMKENSKNE